jgi:hypothetical protein
VQGRHDRPDTALRSVPMIFGYEFEGKTPYPVLSRRGREGRKIDILSRNDTVCFEMDCAHGTDRGAQPAGTATPTPASSASERLNSFAIPPGKRGPF